MAHTETTPDAALLQGPQAADAGADRLEAAARALPRRRLFDDMPDKGLFAVFALVGFVAIIALKTRTPAPAHIVAALSVASMLLYGALAWRLPTVRMRPDRLGDNFYYLGFIFTLASLSATLIEIGFEPRIEELLGNFGIALTTTVVGVAGRVLFVQMRGELDDIEGQVRRDLAAASADLRAQLVLSLREFETFQTGVFQASSDAIRKVTTETEQAVRDAAAATLARIEATAADSQRQAELTVQMLTKVNAALGELPALAKLELPSERLEKQIAALAGHFAAVVAQMEALQVLHGRRRRRRWYFLFLR